MSVTAQHLDYLRTALRTLDASSENQYKIRGQPRSDKVRCSDNTEIIFICLDYLLCFVSLFIFYMDVVFLKSLLYA